MLQRIYRMQKSAGFNAVFRQGKSYASRYVVIYIVKNHRSQFGFIASKKVGNAIKRNRAKRLMREAVRLNLKSIGDQVQMVLIARTAINGASLQEVEKSLVYIWRKAGIYNEKNS